jgi:hypothetical protein
MKKSDFFDSKYFKPGDLGGQPKVVTIETVTMETFRNNGQDTPKAVCHFRGVRKPLILNRVNYETIEDITGSDDTSDWPGHRIELFPSTVEVDGKMTDCVRVRTPDQAELPTRRPIKSSEPDDLDDPIPF